ncbi:MAG: ribosomal-processing cysteine protease Prp [Lachnospiraceae bacterium]|jgi:hypothetical protein|nr:ribosomal-processing cysteine protease Prp [Lachnospiraceae bacterium]
MVNVTFFKKKEGSTEYISGFHFSGHAGFAESGKDIVCAGVSALVLNAINSIEAFTEDRFTCEVEEKSGDVSFSLVEAPSTEANLLLESLLLGITGISETYQQYITLDFREV